MTEYNVHAQYDTEAGVWVAESTDVPGLATEAETVDALVAKLRVMIPELLHENGVPPSGVSVHIVGEYRATLAAS